MSRSGSSIIIIIMILTKVTELCVCARVCVLITAAMATCPCSQAQVPNLYLSESFYFERPQKLVEWLVTSVTVFTICLSDLGLNQCVTPHEEPASDLEQDFHEVGGSE